MSGCWQVRRLAVCASTERELERWLRADGPPEGEPWGRMVVARRQRFGRGQQGRVWQSPAGGLWLSAAFPWPADPGSSAAPPLAMALGLVLELEHLGGSARPLPVAIKWPNDIYLGDLKTSGLLAETVSTCEGLALVLGIGVNVNTLDFPSELSATSLLQKLASPVLREIDRNTLAKRLLECLHAEFQRLDDDFSAAIAEVRERSWLLHRQIRAQAPHGEVFGRVLDLDEEGHLLLELADGTVQTLASADHVRAVH